MNSLMQLYNQHPILFISAATFLGNYVWSAFIGALPAPTKDSSQKYIFWFKFFNLLAANIARARNTSVENSPNFGSAVQKVADMNGGKIPNGVVNNAKKNPLSLT